MAEDEDLILIARNAQQGQPIPNLFFAAVQFLLLKKSDSELVGYYPSMCPDPRPVNESFPIFKSFCLDHRAEIEHILRTRLVQTNVIRRSSYLYPDFCLISNLAAGRPLSILEIGASAGLNLMWDKFAYNYGDGEIRGVKNSQVMVRSSFRGNVQPAFPDEIPTIESRMGIDLNVINLRDQNERLWLRSLIWPEHTERIEIQERAIELFLNDPPKMVNGDAVKLLPQLLQDTPSGGVACVFHTHVANQIPKEGKMRLFDNFEEYGQRHDVFHLFNNIGDSDLHLEYYLNGEKRRIDVAKIDGHARWIEWQFSE